MMTKKQTEIPPHIKITKCPPSDGNGGKSLRSMAKKEERQLEKQAEAERQKKRYEEAIAAGMSIPEAALYAVQQ